MIQKIDMYNDTDNYLLNIPLCTYNHESFIAQAIEGVIMQKTNFKFRLYIGEDASTDNTKNIVIKYAQNYPGIIFPIFHEKNIGPSENSRILFSKCTSKYIALLDGDDYWTDPYKLQKQVDFLEGNPEYAMVAGGILLVDENNKNIETNNQLKEQ